MIARGKVLCLLLAVALLGVIPLAASGEIQNLTPQEQQFLQGLPDRDAQGAQVTGPTHYVAPWIVYSERSMSPAPWPNATADEIREYLLSNPPTGGSRDVGPLINGDFETGDFTGWTTQGARGTGYSSLCGTPLPPEAAIKSPGLQHYALFDPCINFVWQGAHAAMLGDSIPWGYDPNTEPQCNSLSQDVVIPSNPSQFSFAYAVLASNPGHGWGDDPYFNVRVEDLTTHTVLYDVTDYTTSYNPADPCNPWCLGGWDYYGGADVVYRCWTNVVLDLSSIAGDTVRLSLLASDCTPDAHFCEAFLDGAGVQPCLDDVPPEAASITGTCAPDSADFCVTLQWLAPVDSTQVLDPNEDCVDAVQAAHAYDIRWSASPILTPADFAAANQVGGEPAPAAPGTPESFTFCGLPTGPVYVALVSIDYFFNVSDMTTTMVNCTENEPPDCSQAAPSLDELWPPDHQFIPVSILGVTDPDGDPITIVIDGVTQDEETNTLGDGNFCPDAMIADGLCELRSERSGLGNGRVYAINFTAYDDDGANCSGTVYVCVPHSQSPHQPCVDDGQWVNSLICDDGTIHASGSSSVVAQGDPSRPHVYGVEVRGGAATISYYLPSVSAVRVSVFDLLGRQVAALGSGQETAGLHQLIWNTQGVASGTYFVRMQACGSQLRRSFVIVK